MTRASITCVSREGRTVTGALESFLTPARRDAVRSDANAWIKRLRHARYDGASMRDRFQYRGDSLWWFTELYLHKTRRLETAVGTIAALDAACEAHDPARLVVDSSDSAVADSARAFGAARRRAVEVRGAGTTPTGGSAWSSYLIGLTSRLPRWRPARIATPAARPAVAAFVHTAFWRAGDANATGGQETYIGPVLDVVAKRVPPGGLHFVGVGPRRNFRARRWWDPVALAGATPAAITPVERLAPRTALAGSIDLWRRRRTLAAALTAGDDVHAMAQLHGCDLWPLLQSELEGVALLQWPWSARAMDEAGAALDALAPRAVLTYAEAGGWGRALVLEARRRGVPSIGLQHGFIYRHWLNYLHEADEMQSSGGAGPCPIPDRTCVFDDYARSHLIEAGRYPGAAVQVTGNPRLDDLAARVATARAGRDVVRGRYLSGQEDRLAVLAAKYSEIGPHLAGLMAALPALTGVRLVIKPHPAETADAYRPASAGVQNVSIAGADADLATLLAAADAIVTMNSTVAIDGLVLGVPALVLGLPNNLSPFVDAGVMLGAGDPGEVSARLRAILYDPDVRPSLADAARRFAERAGMRADGHAADRTAAEILALASAR